jgi:hypothetical protein
VIPAGGSKYMISIEKSFSDINFSSDSSRVRIMKYRFYF